MDYILNGQAHGDVASLLLEKKFNTNVMRPYSMPRFERDGKTPIVNSDGNPAWGGTYLTINGKPQLVSNATALLRKDDWLYLDRAIVQTGKAPLRLISALQSRGLTFNVPGGMGKTVLQTQNVSDISDAEISMNGVRESRRDRPVFDLTNLPLPIIHKDFSFYLREIEASRNGGSPLDTTTAELASRKVSETVEKLAIGSLSAYKYAGGYIYGLINYPGRLTKVMTRPTVTGWTPHTFMNEIRAMKQQSQDAKHYGPWILFISSAWDQYLDDDYYGVIPGSTQSSTTVRERVTKITDIVEVVTLNYLTGYQAVLVQATTDVIREVIGMPMTTLQWELHGGLELRFKVMQIAVPQLRSDFNGNTGIVHGVAA